MKVPMQASLIILALLGAAGVARADAPKAKEPSNTGNPS